MKRRYKEAALLLCAISGLCWALWVGVDELVRAVVARI
jgi:hypothetical protein